MPMHRDHAVHAPSGMLVPPVPPARRRHVAALAVALGAVVAGGAAHAAQSCPQLPPGAGVPPLSLTPLVVRPLQTVIEPVPATDGLVHLAYAAQATNMHQGRAEILSIVPVDPLDKFRPTGRNRVLDSARTSRRGLRIAVRAAGGKPARAGLYPITLTALAISRPANLRCCRRCDRSLAAEPLQCRRDSHCRRTNW